MNLNLTLIGQMGTLLVLWWFVHKHIWPLIAEAVEKRNAKIAEGLSLADKAKFSLQNAEQEAELLVQNAKTQALEIVSRAQKEADKLLGDAKSQAKLVGEQEVQAARGEFEQEVRKARDNLRKELAELVLQGATQVIGREVNAKDHQRLLQELSEKL